MYTHDICLGTNRYQSVDVLADRHQDLSSHVTTLLRSRRLILNVYTSSTFLNEQLGKLHDGCKTAMSRIRIGYDWSQEVGVGNIRAVCFWRGEALFALLSIVEELRHEKVADLIRYGGLLALAACS
jgi:hypothetical protein